MAKTSWIENMYKQYGGEQWLVGVTPENIQNNGKRIAKDILRGNINYEKYGNVFLDNKFMENLMISLNAQLEEYNLYYLGVSMYGQTPQGMAYPNIGYHVSKLQGICTVYNEIIMRLNRVKASNNIGYLIDTPVVLAQYKNILN